MDTELSKKNLPLSKADKYKIYVDINWSLSLLLESLKLPFSKLNVLSKKLISVELVLISELKLSTLNNLITLFLMISTFSAFYFFYNATIYIKASPNNQLVVFKHVRKSACHRLSAEPVGWGCRIHQLHINRGVWLPNEGPDMTLNNLMMTLQ